MCDVRCVARKHCLACNTFCSCREKTVIEEESQPNRGRRRSMENLELVKLTPDKVCLLTCVLVLLYSRMYIVGGDQG